MRIPEPLIVFDQYDPFQLERLLDEIHTHVKRISLHYSALLCYPQILRRILHSDWRVYLDFKVFDDPDRIKNLLFWCNSNDIEAVSLAVTPESKISFRALNPRTKVLAVRTLISTGILERESTLKWAKKVKQANFHGVICPIGAALWVREVFPEAIIACPGLRLRAPHTSNAFEFHPTELIYNEVDYFFVDRLVTNSANPLGVLRRIEDLIFSERSWT